MWPSTTAGYLLSGETYPSPLTPLPDAAQETLMDQTYQADSVIDTLVPATVGMFGYAATLTDSSGNDYTEH